MLGVPYCHIFRCHHFDASLCVKFLWILFVVGHQLLSYSFRKVLWKPIAFVDCATPLSLHSYACFLVVEVLRSGQWCGLLAVVKY